MDSGAILVDKPAGVSSAEVIRVLKRRFRFARIGHAGTLDPAATGLLVVLIGEATKLQDVLMAGTKSYQGVIRLGIATATDDLEGEKLTEDLTLAGLIDGTKAEHERLLAAKFIGPIVQVPPAYSAIKVDGERSYDIARRGESVVLSSRQIVIYRASFKFLDRERIAYDIDCSKGTYIRSIARDAGAALGVPACAESIRRTQSGQFRIERAVSLDSLNTTEDISAALIGPSELVGELPKLELDRRACERLYQGQQDVLNQAVVVTQLNTVALIGPDGVTGVAERKDEQAPWRIRFLFQHTQPLH